MRFTRALVAAVLSVVVALGGAGVARAEIDESNGTNVQQGDNRATTSQKGQAKTGDAVAGQVGGVVSSGDTSIDATNMSSDVEVQSGDVDGINTINMFLGQDSSNSSAVGAGLADITNSNGTNVQEGDNRATVSQSSNYATGDGIGGQVIGAVTTAGGRASIVAANSSTDLQVQTGSVDGRNEFAALVGQNDNTSGSTVISADVEQVTCFFAGCSNIQEGDNRMTSSQRASASTGDGVAGQVIGSVSAGRTSIDARNTSDGVDVKTGDADLSNRTSALVGQNTSACQGDCGTGVIIADVDSVSAVNVQEGDNRLRSSQTASAKTGDGVAGQVIGGVTTAGGSASIVAANTSRDSDVTTGDATPGNDFAAFVGQGDAECFFDCEASTGIGAADITTVLGAKNVQEGDNRANSTQSASASTGDGIAGQVIGGVSGGRLSVDARNESTDVHVNTGNATAGNKASSLVGQSDTNCGTTCTATVVVGADVISVTNAANVQEGDNATSFRQAATASSGDGVGGQVIGAVTSAGGSASVVAANTSDGVDVKSGAANAENTLASLVGQNLTACVDTCTSSVGIGDVTNTFGAANIQEGTNRLTGSQSASASSGDGVGGQVLGLAGAGRASLDATNRSVDSSVESGAANATNNASALVGQNFVSGTGGTSIGAADVTNSSCGGQQCNIQEGDNRASVGQSADALSGDSVTGQVFGVVTSAGGSARVVASNTSTEVDSTSGDSNFDNNESLFVGLDVGGSIGITGFAADVPLLEQVS